MSITISLYEIPFMDRPTDRREVQFDVEDCGDFRGRLLRYEDSGCEPEVVAEGNLDALLMMANELRYFAETGTDLNASYSG